MAAVTSLLLIPVTDAQGNPDFKIVAGGYASPDYNSLTNPYCDWTLACYNSDGTVDTSFGASTDLAAIPGVVVDDPSIFNSSDVDAEIGAMELSPNGQDIVAVGSAAEEDNSGQIAMATYSLSGGLQSHYASVTVQTGGLGGLGPADPFGPGAVAGSLAFESDGSIIASTQVGLNDNDGGQAGTPGWTIVHINLDGTQDMDFGGTDAPTATFDGTLPGTGADAPNESAWLPGSVIATSNGIFTVGAGLNKASLGISQYEPLIASYDYSSSSSDLSAAASSSGGVNLSWTNSGAPVDGYEILRATSVAGLSSPGALLSVVGPGQSQYTDSNVPASSSPYYYEVLPFNTDDTGAYMGAIAPLTPAVSNSVILEPIGATFQLVQTLTVPLGGSIETGSALGDGTYLIKASSAAPLSLGDGYDADAAYWYSAAEPSINGTTLDWTSSGSSFQTAPFGLGISDSDSTAGFVVPNWGPLDAANHTYSETVAGSGQTLSFQYQDADRAALTAEGQSAQSVDVSIYKVSSSATAGATLAITSPATVGGVPAVIGVATPINIISSNPGGSAAWSLSLVFPNGHISQLAIGTQGVGQDPLNGATVATLDPALYPNGDYTLQLTSGTTTRSLTIDIETVAKLGDLTDTVTDGAINTIAGSIDVNRVYDSAQAGTPGDFGNGWNLNLLDSNMQVTTVPNQYDIGDAGPIRKATRFHRREASCPAAARPSPSPSACRAR